jgi:arginine-tRNA-protein transferase
LIIKLNNSNLDIEKHLKRNVKLTDVKDRDSLESFLTLSPDKPPVTKLEIKLVRSWPPSKEFQKTLNEEHELYVKYQTSIHNDSLLECNKTQFQRFLCTSPLLMQSYDGPLLPTAKSGDAMSRIDANIAGDLEQLGYGSFHQQYRINGKLIAVGVIDILNNCVSSVYFFYDPEYNFLKMGTYSALREIGFVRQLSKIDPNLKWYYLGFYAHSCRKMRYKVIYVKLNAR